ncbi:prepilin-type N-terminal cleavage/methylation domain-containing protein [Paenibacillus sp. NPDC058174]|uniref:prepilin-type N-terminal cleavage/methylation domain-containing protein n=1 Tax=Paenibacillus sp. NPDC058174 TaxID=3346366 RepID=UPI0036D7DDDB
MLMALKRNEKGLTLIELLAVLVIVGIIAAIAIPAIGGTIAKSKEKADEATEAMITDAALRYVIDLNVSQTQSGVLISKLIADGYLNAAPKWNDTSKTKTKFDASFNANKWDIKLE